MLVADLNQDGNADLLFYRAPAISVMLNDGSGNFSKPVSVSLPSGFDNVQAVALGDFNGDGFPDISACVLQSRTLLQAIAVYLNDHGQFSLSQTLPAPSGCSGIAAGDANRDGKIDVAVTFGSFGNDWLNPTAENGITTWFGDGTGHFYNSITQNHVAIPRADSYGPCMLRSSVGADFDSDGTLALVLFGDCAGSDVAYLGSIYAARGDGTGHYTLTSISDTSGRINAPAEIKDIKSNGHLDLIFVTQTLGPHGSSAYVLRFLMNDGKGNFKLFPGISTGGYGGASTQINSGTFADLNGDGIPDAIQGFMQTGLLPEPSEAGITIFAGQTDGSFKQSDSWVFLQGDTYGVPGFVNAIVSADFDHDGKPDIATLVADGQGGPPKLYVYLNNRH